MSYSKSNVKKILNGFIKIEFDYPDDEPNMFRTYIKRGKDRIIAKAVWKNFYKGVFYMIPEVNILDGETLEERIAELKILVGLSPDQSFQDLDVDISDMEDDDED